MSSSFDPTIQTEEIGFDADQLVVCRSCSRNNAPNRPECIYCGTELETTAVRKTERSGTTPEEWESGYNLVVTIDNNSDLSQLDASFADLAGKLQTRISLPLARYSTVAATETAKGNFSQALNTAIVPDDELDLDTPAKRLMGIEFGNGTVTFAEFLSGERRTFSADDISLIVMGSISQNRVESNLKRGKRGSSEMIDETFADSDEKLLDIYTSTGIPGYRVNVTGFDFSCLGSEKGMIASTNLDLLASKLASVSSSARRIDAYGPARSVLDKVWPPESRDDSTGMRFVGFGRRQFGKVSTVNNEKQFLRFSRLQWQMK